MNNEELKKKISQIISEYCCPSGKTHKQLYGDDRMCYSKMNFAECNPITECTDALISAGIGDVKPLEISDASKEQSSINYYCEMREWKDKCRAAEHRAEEAEKLKNQYGRALLNLARRYVVKTNMTLSHGSEPHSRSTDIEMLALYIIANECEQAEKELAEERKDAK